MKTKSPRKHPEALPGIFYKDAIINCLIVNNGETTIDVITAHLMSLPTNPLKSTRIGPGISQSKLWDQVRQIIVACQKDGAPIEHPRGTRIYRVK